MLSPTKNSICQPEVILRPAETSGSGDGEKRERLLRRLGLVRLPVVMGTRGTEASADQSVSVEFVG
jgi:hypothetical protein